MKKLGLVLIVMTLLLSSGNAYGQNTQETNAESVSNSGAVIENVDLSGPGSSKVINRPDNRTSSLSGSTAGAEAEGGEAAALSAVSIVSDYKQDKRVYPTQLLSPQGIFILPDGSVPVSGSVGDESSTYQITLTYEDIVAMRKVLNDKKVVRYKGVFEEFFDSFGPCKPCRDYYERKGFTIVGNIFRKGTRKNGTLTFISDVSRDNLINRKALLRECYVKSGYIPVGELNVEGSEQDGILSDFTGHTYTHGLNLTFYVAASLLWEEGVTLAIFDGGIQQVGRGQTVSSASSMAYPTANIGTGAGIAGLTQESEIRGKPVFRTVDFIYDSDYAINPDNPEVPPRKTMVDPGLLKIKNAVLDYQLPVSPKSDKKELSESSRKRRLKNAKKIEGSKQ